MGRPVRCRKVCSIPDTKMFGTMERKIIDTNDKGEAYCRSSEHTLNEYAVMTVEEYEVVRLLDYLDFTQAECSKQMDISRTTVTMIYNQARKKIAVALVEGKEILIRGGNYEECVYKDSCDKVKDCCIRYKQEHVNKTDNDNK